MSAQNFRSDSVYLSPKTKRRLRWLREVTNRTFGTGGFPIKKSDASIVTSDEIAERLLNDKIEADYPSIVSMEKRMNALEDQMVTELGKEREPK